MKEKYIRLAERFVEYCKSGDIYDESFDFKIDDGNVHHIFGTILIEHFDTIFFVTSVYGGFGATTFTPEFFDKNNFDNFNDDDWNYLLEEATEYFYKNYKNWGEPII